MKKILSFFMSVFLLAGVFQSYGYAETEIPQELQSLYARSAVLMDGSSGRILFEKNGYESLPMASTTKIMTCILALEKGEKEAVVTVSAYAASQPEVRLGLRQGEEYYLGDLLHSLMLESHNDSAVAIAEYIGGTTEAFATLMNQQAKNMGCSDTHFVTPNGLDESDEGGIHRTTAADLAKIMSYCIVQSPKRAEFLEITGTRSYSFQDVSGSRSFSCYNHNSFLDMMEGALTGKTGFTSAAGYCYVGAVQREERLFVVALLACGWPYNKTYKWKDMRKLAEYGLENYHNRKIEYTAASKTLSVEEGLAENGDPWAQVQVEAKPQIPSEEEAKSYLLREDEEFTSQITIKDKLLAPVEKGTTVGRVRYYLDGELLEEYPVVTMKNIEKKYLEHCVWWVLGRYGFQR